VVERHTLDRSLVVRVWVEPHDRTLRARIVAGTGPERTARGVDAITSLVRTTLQELEDDLAGLPDEDGCR
jgi:hypothetical protein